MSQTADKLPRMELNAPANASGLTFFSPNYAPGESFAYFPTTGNIMLYFGPGSPAPTQVYIFHQGGSTTPVSVGQAQYSVNSGDYLFIIGQAASCKIQWYYF